MAKKKDGKKKTTTNLEEVLVFGFLGGGFLGDDLLHRGEFVC